MSALQPTFSWTDVWTMAITRPRPETYETLLTDADHRPKRSVRWMFLTSMVLAIITYNAVFNNPAFQQQMADAMAQGGAAVSPAAVGQSLLIVSLCAMPFAALFNVALYVLLTVVMDFAAARVSGQTDTQPQRARLLYLVGAAVAPLTIISALANILPALLSVVLSAAVLALQAFIFVQMVRAVYRLAPQQAILAALLPTLLFYGVQWLVVGSVL